MQKWVGENINTPAYWDQVGLKDFEQGELRDFHWRFDRIIKHLKPSKILDVGCGLGSLSRRINSSFDGSATVVGVDFSKEQIDICNRISKNRSDLHPKEKYLVADIREGLPFPDGYFDYVVCSEVLEHLSNPDQAARELKRVCKQGGAIIITTPYNEQPDYKEHVQMFTESDFYQLFNTRLISFEKFRTYILARIVR